jgi:predicted permease
MRWRSRKSRQQDLEREVRSHLDLEAEEQRAAGLRSGDARYAAQRAFGNTALVQENTREMWGWGSLERLRADLSYALRTIRRSPGLTVVGVLSLALGIGANTAIFSLFDAVLVKSLPVREPDRLVYLRGAGGDAELPYPVYSRLRDRTQTLEGLVASSSGVERAEAGVDGGAAESANVQLVSGNYFSVLGVTAAVGRLLKPEDDLTPGANPVAVVSHGYWSRRMGGDPAVVGRSLRLNGLPFTIVGIAPAEFFGTTVGYSPDIWTPIMMMQAITHDAHALDSSNVWWLNLVGRLRPGVRMEQAAAETVVLYRQIDGELHPGQDRKGPSGHPIELVPAAKGLDALRTKFSKPLQVLMVVVALVLSIACANLANLLLSRAAARRPELALRLALGASRARLVRQLLTESLLLAGAGGVCGLAFAQWGSGLLLRIASNRPDPIPLHLAPDFRTLAFTVAISLATGLLFGIAPAWRASRLDPGPTLKTASTGLTAGSPLGKSLIAAQAGISLLLLMGAGLFVSSLHALRSVDTGFRREHLLLMDVDARWAGYQGAALKNLARRVFDAMNGAPGVRAASFAECGMFMGCGSDNGISLPGVTPPPGKKMNFRYDSVGPGYFETMGIPLSMGRTFTLQDDGSAPKVAVVSESFARRFFPDRSPLGRHFGAGRNQNFDTEIVGVVKDVKLDSVKEAPRATFFLPFLQTNASFGVLEIRTSGEPLTAASLIRQRVREIDPAIRVNLVASMEQRIDASIARERLLATLSGFFGVLALLLVSIGLYGVISYNVTRRTHELGIRISLGASRGKIVWMVLRDCLAMSAAGVAIGLPLCWWLSRLVASLLFGVTPHNPAILSAAAGALIAVAALAGYRPARRASRVDPMVALRYE